MNQTRHQLETSLFGRQIDYLSIEEFMY